jgi:uncharacterized protein
MHGLTVREIVCQLTGEPFLSRLAHATSTRLRYQPTRPIWSVTLAWRASAYERLLTSLFVLETLPAWSTNRLSRITRTGKRYLVDTSLVAAALDLDERAVLRDGDLLGRMIDTFVLAQIRPEVALTSLRSRLYHLRTRDARHEIDLIAELAGGDVIAIEIKSSAAPKRDDARHLEWLRDQLGDRFLAGAVLHTGPRPFQLAERIFALPICTLWG